MIYTIYKLCCDDTDKFYVGSTRNRKERVRKHRDDSKVKDTLINKTIREFGGWDNWRMVDLEQYTCDTRRQAEKREEEWRLNLKADLNMIRCHRTFEEKVQYHKDYYGNHKPYLDEYNKESYKNNKEAILEKCKERYENNKEAILERHKAYNQANKETIAAKQAVQFECECGGKYTRHHKARHFKCKKHQNWLLKCHTAEVQVD